MLDVPESLWAHLGSSSVYTAIVPIVIGGGLTLFKPWLVSEERILERANLKKQALIEKVNKSLHHLLSRLENADLELEDLRGAPAAGGAPAVTKSRSGLELTRPEQPDLISNYTVELLQTISFITRLFRIYDCVRLCYWLLFITVVIGVIELFVALPIEPSRPYISMSCYPLVGFQILIAFMIRRWTGRFEECERMS